MKTNLLTLVITLTLGIILAGSLLMPVINDTTTISDTYANDGVIHLEKYTTESPDLTLIWDYTAPTQISVNGEVIALPQDVSYLSLDMGNDWFVRYTRDAQRMSFISSTASLPASVNDSTSLTVTLSQGAVTATNGNTSASGTYDEFLCITSAANSSYVMKAADATVKMNGDSEFYAYGVTGQYAFKITGNIEDGATVTTIRGGTVTITDVTIDYTEDNQHTDLYTLDKITFKYGSSTATYNMFVVPTEVTAERTQHLNDGEIAIMNAIPFLIIAALVVMAAGALYLKRED